MDFRRDEEDDRMQCSEVVRRPYLEIVSNLNVYANGKHMAMIDDRSGLNVRHVGTIRIA